MTTLALKYLSIHKAAYAKARFFSLPALNWKAVCCFGFFVSICLMVFYIYQIIYLTKGNYFVDNYQKDITKLLQENKGLEIEFAKTGFLEKVVVNARDLNFQKTTAIKYIQIPDNSLAKAK